MRGRTDREPASVGRVWAVTAAVVGLVWIVIAGVSTGRLDGDRDVRSVSIFDSAEPPATDPHELPPLRVLVSSMVSPTWTLELYDKLVHRLGATVRRRGVLVQRRNYAEANEALRHGDVDLAFMCSGAFVQGEREGVGARLLAVPIVRGSSSYRSYVLVRADGPWKTLEELRGARAVYVDPSSLTGAVYLQARLRELGLPDNKFFASVGFSGSHDRSIEAVARGIADVAPVDHLVYEMMVEANPALRNKVRILERSPAFAAPPVVVPRSSPASLNKALLAALTAMHRDPAGRSVLHGLMIDRFEPVDASRYEAVRRVWTSSGR